MRMDSSHKQPVYCMHTDVYVCMYVLECSVCVCVCVCTHHITMNMCTHTHIRTYTYIQTEKSRSLPQYLQQHAPRMPWLNAYQHTHIHTNREIEVTPSVIATARTTYAMSKYRVPSYFDSWEGYAAERARFLASLTPANGSAVVYGGDSHSAWGGVHVDVSRGGAHVCAEYDATSVTSTGEEVWLYVCVHVSCVFVCR
jgi:hypothetical protein